MDALRIPNSYGWTNHNPAALVQLMHKSIKRLTRLREALKFDTIAFTGISGAPLAFSASAALNTNTMYIRKPGENSHGHQVECNSLNGEIRRYIIVDDFIDSGETCRSIHKAIKKTAYNRGERTPTCAAVFLYDPYARPTTITIGRRNVNVYINA